MNLLSGGGFSTWLPIACLSFTLPVDGHVLNETPCWGEPICRVWLPVWVLVFLLRDFFLIRLLSGVRLAVRVFWWKSFCWGSDYLFDLRYSCWGTFFLMSRLSGATVLDVFFDFLFGSQGSVWDDNFLKTPLPGASVTVVILFCFWVSVFLVGRRFLSQWLLFAF